MNNQSVRQIETYSQLLESLNKPDIGNVVEHVRHDRLKQYFTTWIEAGCRFKEWSLRDEFCRYEFHKHPLWTEEEGRPVVKAVRFNGSYEDYKRLDVSASGDDSPTLTDEQIDDILEEAKENDGIAQATSAFSKFLRSPFYNAVGQCSYRPCSRFYLMTTRHSGRRYCSQKCASADTAVKAMTEKNERIHRLKLKALQKASIDFEHLPRTKQTRIEETEGWKSWIARRANAGLKRTGYPVTMTFVTRVVNEGKLRKPTM